MNIVVDNSEHSPHHFGCTTDFNIGIEEGPTTQAIRISPMPASDRLNVFCEGNGNRLRLIDPQGREVMGLILYNGDNSLDVTALSRGSLYAEVRDAQGTILYRSPLLLQ